MVLPSVVRRDDLSLVRLLFVVRLLTRFLVHGIVRLVVQHFILLLVLGRNDHLFLFTNLEHLLDLLDFAALGTHKVLIMADDKDGTAPAPGRGLPSTRADENLSRPETKGASLRNWVAYPVVPVYGPPTGAVNHLRTSGAKPHKGEATVPMYITTSCFRATVPTPPPG